MIKEITRRSGNEEKRRNVIRFSCFMSSTVEFFLKLSPRATSNHNARKFGLVRTESFTVIIQKKKTLSKVLWHGVMIICLCLCFRLTK